jgi:nicotinamidase-related amidase
MAAGKPAEPVVYERVTREERWDPSQTVVIVCDVWDYHHCLNAVRRLDEFVPRLNMLLKEARRRGATIIHAPSDCMPAYVDHPARHRAVQTPVATPLPAKIQHWCSLIPPEETAAYPIDQSDGGEDDDPEEHREWAAKLKQLGRNPAMPWKKQSDQIEISPQNDYISDRGDEVWNVLRQRGIKNVILTGVHVNMCVLGRPFGLRQMAHNGMRVVLVRDMTDAMYNPQRWPYVDHYTGTDLVISHIERFVCPTISSEQILGGERFQFRNDVRTTRDLAQLASPVARAAAEQQSRDWKPMAVGSTWHAVCGQDEYAGSAWYRCAVRIPASWMTEDGLELTVKVPAQNVEAWCNGQAATVIVPPTKKPTGQVHRLRVSRADCVADDYNLLVIRVQHAGGRSVFDAPPLLASGKRQLPLDRRLECRLGNDPTWANIPLPAKFGIAPSYVYEP